MMHTDPAVNELRRAFPFQVPLFHQPISSPRPHNLVQRRPHGSIPRSATLRNWQREGRTTHRRWRSVKRQKPMRVVGLALFLSISAACVTLGAPRPKDKEGRTPVDAPGREWSIEKIERDGEVCSATYSRACWARPGVVAVHVDHDVSPIPTPQFVHVDQEQVRVAPCRAGLPSGLRSRSVSQLNAPAR